LKSYKNVINITI